jgi:glycosyltransferase involved in cell wall biosynthesis
MLPLRVSVIVTTFNSPKSLHLSLESIFRQTIPPFEVIIADDGSTAETKGLIDAWKEKMNLCHTWQPDQSFRAARARNLAIARVTGDYVIFIDGDCILPATFIGNHLSIAQKGYAIAGGRHLLHENLSNWLLKCPDALDSSLKKIKSLKLRTLDLGRLRYLFRLKWTSVRTCNLAVFYENLIKIHGFDEEYVGWGLEDSDLAIRLERSGVTWISGRLLACVIHLSHAKYSRAQISKNKNRLKTRLEISGTSLPNKSLLSAL